MKQLLLTIFYPKEVEILKDYVRVTEEVDVLKEAVDELEAYSKSLKEEIVDLKKEVVSPIDAYLSSKFVQVNNIAYKQKRTSKGEYYSVYINQMITPEAFEVLKFQRPFLTYYPDKYKFMQEIGNALAKHTTWVDEQKLYDTGDYYLYPEETLTGMRNKCDCLAEDTLINTKEGMKEIKDVSVGDYVLSYDFKEQKQVWKQVTNKWNKGILETKRVYFSNGTWVDMTKDHKLMFRDNYKADFKYIKKEISKITLKDSKSWQRKLVSLKNAEYIVEDVDWLTEDCCFIIGHFLAEGWCDKFGCSTSGYDIPLEIEPKLRNINQNYHITYNGSGVPCLRFYKSEFSQFLHSIKRSSFDFELDEILMRLPKNKLQKLLDGFFCGDGHYHIRDKKANIVEKVYSTSCEKFAKQLVIIHKQLNQPVQWYYQVNHQGAGNKPIWRVLSYPNTESYRDYGIETLSELSISKIEDVENKTMYDIEVEDTHTFFLWNGVLSHNCEDVSFTMVSFDPDNMGVCYGFYYPDPTKSARFGHAYPVFLFDNNLYIVETTGTAVKIDPFNDPRYMTYFIVTKNKTYRLKNGVDFGFIASY